MIAKNQAWFLNGEIEDFWKKNDLTGSQMWFVGFSKPFL